MTQWLSQWVTRWPIELFWTSRNSSQFDNYFENNKNYSSLSDSKKSMHLKYSENTGSQNCVYKSRTAHRIQIKMFLKHQILICEKIHSCQSMNFDLVWRGVLLYFIFYILPGIAGARYFCTKYWDWDRNINNKDRNTYVGADQGERWWKLNHLGEHLRMQSGEKPTKYLLAHF